MKKALFGVVFLIISVCANAQVVDVSKLNKEQRKEIIGAIEKIDGKNTAVVVREEAQEWVKIGENMGDALIGLTSKLRVEIDAFSQTTVGKITIATVMFKIVGKEALDVFEFFFEKTLGISLVLIAMLTMWKLPSAKFWFNEIEYEQVPVLFGLTTRTVIKSVGTETDPGARQVISIFGSAIIFIVGLLIAA